MRLPFAALFILTIGCAGTPSRPPKITSQQAELVAWSDDGASALARVEQTWQGGRAYAFILYLPTNPEGVDFVLSKHCIQNATILKKVLAQRGFSKVRVRPSACGRVSQVVSVDSAAMKEVAASRVPERSVAPNGSPWVSFGGQDDGIGEGKAVEHPLIVTPGDTVKVALSASRRMLVLTTCDHGNCSISAECSGRGGISDLGACFPELAQPTAVPAKGSEPAEPIPSTLEKDREWWDGDASRSPVEVTFTPDGQDHYSCVRQDGSYWTQLADDTGLRVESNGRITRKDGAPGEIDASGALHLAGLPGAHIDPSGRLFCNQSVDAYAQIEGGGTLYRKADGHRIAALRGSVDWRKNRRAAFLLLVDACQLAGSVP